MPLRPGGKIFCSGTLTWKMNGNIADKRISDRGRPDPSPGPAPADTGEFPAAPEGGSSPLETSHGGTVEFLLRRMQHQSDLPVLAESIRTLNQVADAGDQDLGRLAGVLVRDFALTSKILKVVNSAFYSRFSGHIGSVSRAIVVLGINTVRSIATSLILFEHLHDRARAERLKDEIAGAVFAATLARQVAAEAGLDDGEGAFLCGMLHNLGRLLVTYYLPEETAEIERLTGQEQMAAPVAEQRVLGLTLEQVGIEVARAWNFPADVTMGMVRADPDAPGDLTNPYLKIRLIAGFANEAASLIGESGEGDAGARRRLLKRYRMGLAISDKSFERVLCAARREFMELSSDLVRHRSPSPFLGNLLHQEPETGDAPADPEMEAGRVLETAADGGLQPADLAMARPSPDAERILTEGLQELSSMLAEGAGNVSQVLNVTLETIYRAMGFQRVLVCLRDRSGREYVARLGFGREIDAYLERFRFPAAYSADVFHVVLKNGVDLHITDTGAANIRDRLPDWYRRLPAAGSFLLFPLQVRQRPLGLIYADHPRPDGLSLSEEQLNLLKALRNQVLLGFRARG